MNQEQNFPQTGVVGSPLCLRYLLLTYHSFNRSGFSGPGFTTLDFASPTPSSITGIFHYIFGCLLPTTVMSSSNGVEITGIRSRKVLSRWPFPAGLPATFCSGYLDAREFQFD